VIAPLSRAELDGQLSRAELDGQLSRAELDGALRKAASVWLRTPGHGDRLVWALWPGRGPHAGSLLVLHGGSEQVVPGLVDGVDVAVTVAAPGSRTALGTVVSRARVLPAGPERDAARELLLAARRGGGPDTADTADVVVLPLLPASGTAPAPR
jgi:hypothetical protein